MKIQLVPDIRSEFPQWIELARVLSQDDVVDTLMFKARSYSQMSFEDAGDAIVALFAWRSVTGYARKSKNQDNDGMFDLYEIAGRLGIDAGIGSVASIGTSLEQADFIMHDVPSGDVTEDAFYAYLNSGGLERGLSVLGRMYEERVFPPRNGVPTAFGVVSTEHNQALVEEAALKAGLAAEAIRSSNVLDEDDRQTWLSHIEAGLALLTKPKVYFSAISLLILQPLYSAYSSVIEDSAKPTIEAALRAVKALIGF